MYLPVDLSNLREMTGGDQEVEHMLFQEFFKSAQTCIDGLEQFADTNQNDQWRRNAHAFKGISLNMGANQLSALCKRAQDECEAESMIKNALLDSIKIEYNLVQIYLKKIMG